jgi:hypothetical protein
MRGGRLRIRLGASVLIAAIGAGCASAAAPAPEGSAGSSEGAPLERIVRPFPVLDATGREHALPFLGGFDAPRPHFLDVDADGDLDVFVQELSNDLRFFENVAGASSAPRYEWRTDRYQGLDIGEWFRFVDLDGDQLVDLLTEERISYIRHYRNRGTRAEPRFERVDSLRDSGGRAIFMDRQNIPALVDVDCDGRLDLFVGRVEGTVARYEAEAPGSERFVLVTEGWEGIEIIGTLGPGGETQGRELEPGGGPSAGGSEAGDATEHVPGAARHGANALAFADFEGDGDVDLFWGDFFEPGVLLIENVGRTCSVPSFDVEPVTLPYADSVRTSGYNAPVPVDLEGDGRLDFAMGVLGGAFNPNRTSSDNLYLWRRSAPDRFELETRRLLDGVDVGSESAPAVADVDGDGLLDLVVGNKIDPRSSDSGLLFFFRNVGSARSPRLRLTDTLRIAQAYNQAPAFGDLNGDGRVDLVLGTWSGDVLVFRGEGSGGGARFMADSTLAFRLPRGSNAMPALGDLDADGDLDLLVGQSNGAVSWYRNEGTPRAPRFVLVEERLGDISAGRRSAPAIFDADGDGLLDLVLGREAAGLMVFRNAGTREAPRFAEDAGWSLPLAPISAPALADVDGDGAVDLLAGSISGGVTYWRGTGRR